MIRSGSTLQYNLVRCLVERTGKGQGHGWIGGERVGDLQEQIERWGKVDELHVIKVHDTMPNAREMMKNGLMRIVYTYRDIRDVAISAERAFGYSGDILLKHLDKAIGVYHELKQFDGVLWQQYEKIIVDIPEAVLTIAGFLGIRVGADTIEAVAADCSLERAKKVATRARRNPVLKFWALMPRVAKCLRAKAILIRLGVPKATLRRIRRTMYYLDRRSLLHHNHISEKSGIIGMWRTDLPKEEREMLTSRYREWLLEAGYSG